MTDEYRLMKRGDLGKAFLKLQNSLYKGASRSENDDEVVLFFSDDDGNHTEFRVEVLEFVEYNENE